MGVAGGGLISKLARLRVKTGPSRVTSSPATSALTAVTYSRIAVMTPTSGNA